MNLDRYTIIFDKEHESYGFVSEGPKGLIKKIVAYRRFVNWHDNIYNLGFGDWDEKNQGINDFVRSNNNDRDKILVTVAATVLDFTERNPGAIIYAEGTTPSRTRLYQMGISANRIEINDLFNIYGYWQGGWKPFQSGHN